MDVDCFFRVRVAEVDCFLSFCGIVARPEGYTYFSIDYFRSWVGLREIELLRSWADDLLDDTESFLVASRFKLLSGL